MGVKGNPHGYEAGFTIEQHRDELIERLGKAIKRIAELEAELLALRIFLTYYEMQAHNKPHF